MSVEESSLKSKISKDGETGEYGVPGIPITDFGRLAQAAGMRVLSFRHEQHAGNAAAIAGYLTGKPGLCLTVSAVF